MAQQLSILVDGDIFAYTAASAVEKRLRWGDEDDETSVWTTHADEAQARQVVDLTLGRVFEKLHATRMIVALSDSENWRKGILPTYKANRKGLVRPMVLAETRQYLRDTYEVYQRPRLEGDDILGILLTHPTLIPGKKICVSLDKDLQTIPGRHYNNGKPEEGVFEVTEAAADRYHLLQTLTGDTTDNYSGCTGVGPKAAQAFLDAPYITTLVEDVVKSTGKIRQKYVKEPTDDVWAGILSLYAKAGYNEDFALQQARVARILRYTDYDFKKKEPILWTPQKNK